MMRGLGARLKAAGRDPALWLAMAAGGLGALAFEPWNWRPLIVLAPLGCFLAIMLAKTAGQALRRAFLFGLIFYFLAIQWLTSLAWVNPLAPAGIVLLAAYLAVYPALIGYVLRRWLWDFQPAKRFFLFASAWLLLEWLRSQGRLAMPLAQLGHAWAEWPLGIQVASVLGEAGVSLTVLVMAGLLFCLIMLGVEWKRQRVTHPERSFPRVPFCLARATISSLLLVVLIFAYSALVLQQQVSQSTSPTGPVLRVALVQPNIQQWDKLASYAHPDLSIQRRLNEAMTQLLEEQVESIPAGTVDLVVLPESAFTEEDFATNVPVRERAGRLARSVQAPVLLGANRDASAADTVEMYNSAWLINPAGDFAASVYDKMRLVPFGESIPYFDLIPGVQSLVGIGSFSEGREHTLFPFSAPDRGTTHTFGVLICFESTFPSMARALVRGGAEFLSVITNDAWYLETAGAAAHHHLSLLRAVETRRWIVRCANTGISAIISPAGIATESLPLNTRGVLTGTIVPQQEFITFYTRFGDVWLILPALMLAGGAAVQWRRRTGKS